MQGLNLNIAEWGASLSADNQTLYFAADTTGTNEGIYTATRSDRSVSFSAATLLNNANINASMSANGSPDLSFDGLTLFFYSNRPGGLGDRDLYLATRTSSQAAFGPPHPLTNLNSTTTDHLPWVSSDQLTILFVSARPGQGQSDIWMATRASQNLMFSPPTEVPGVNTSSREERAALSNDGLTIYFASDRTNNGAQGGLDFWSGTRADIQSAFSNFVDLTVLNSPEDDLDFSLSADEVEAIFSSQRGGNGAQLYRSIRPCQ